MNLRLQLLLDAGCSRRKEKKKENRVSAYPEVTPRQNQNKNAESAGNVSAVKSTVQRPQRDLALQMASVGKDNYSSDRVNPGSVEPTPNRTGWPRDRV